MYDVNYYMSKVQSKAIDVAALADRRYDTESLWTAIKEFRQAVSDFELAARAKRFEQVTS